MKFVLAALFLIAGCDSGTCTSDLHLVGPGTESAWSSTAAVCVSSHTDAGGQISVSDGTFNGVALLMTYGCNPTSSSGAACWTSIGYSDGSTSWQTTDGQGTTVSTFDYGGQFAIALASVAVATDGGDLGSLSGSVSGPLE